MCKPFPSRRPYIVIFVVVSSGIVFLFSIVFGVVMLVFITVVVVVVVAVVVIIVFIFLMLRCNRNICPSIEMTGMTTLDVLFIIFECVGASVSNLFIWKVNVKCMVRL